MHLAVCLSVYMSTYMFHCCLALFLYLKIVFLICYHTLSSSCPEISRECYSVFKILNNVAKSTAPVNSGSH